MSLLQSGLETQVEGWDSRPRLKVVRPAHGAPAAPSRSTAARGGARRNDRGTLLLCPAVRVFAPLIRGVVLLAVPSPGAALPPLSFQGPPRARRGGWERRRVGATPSWPPRATTARLPGPRGGPTKERRQKRAPVPSADAKLKRTVGVVRPFHGLRGRESGPLGRHSGPRSPATRGF